VTAVQRKEPVASTRFLAVQFHELCGRSAAVRVGRQPTRCGPTDTASRCLKADLCGLDVHGFSRWWNPTMDQSAESLAQQALHSASRHVHASEMAAACGSAFLVTTRFRSRRLHPRKSGTLEAGRWCYGRRHHRRMLRWTRDLRAREDGMNFRNPWPDVAIPDLPFSELVLQCCSARTR
jgi:hypothetical protein